MAYNTSAQVLYFGNSSEIVDVGAEVSAVNIPSEVGLLQRVVLGKKYPTVDAGRITYRMSFPRMRMGEASEKLRTLRLGAAFLGRTDDSRCALLTLAGVSGVPQQAAANGEITGGVTLATIGGMTRGNFTAFDGDGNISAQAGFAYYVVTAGSCEITAPGASHSTVVDSPGIAFAGNLSTAGDIAISQASGLEGWLAHDLEIAV